MMVVIVWRGISLQFTFSRAFIIACMPAVLYFSYMLRTWVLAVGVVLDSKIYLQLQR